MMRTCLVWCMIGCMKILVSSVQYNQRCTFSLDTCQWNIGRRWHVQKLDDDIDDKVLIAVDGSNQDKEIGFTDVITSSWLYLISSCSLDIRLTFQFSIENEQDQIEVFLIKKDELQISSIGQWKALTNKNAFEDIESLWQQANITFKAAEAFRIEIEIRHFPDKKIDSTTWFAVDDILVESCPNVRTASTIEQTTTTTASYFNLSHSFSRFHWKFNDTFEEPFSSRLTFLTFILYTLCALVALTLIIILLTILIITYRKHCLPSSTPTIPHRYHSHRTKKPSPIDLDTQTERTMVTTVRPCYYNQ